MKNDVKKFWQNKNVLITGVNGFVGGNLAEYLVDIGANVFGLIRNKTENSYLFYEGIDRKITLISGTLTDYKLIKGIIVEQNIQHCFHLAAQVEVGVAIEYPLLTWDTNVRGTYTLLEAIRENKKNINSVIIASSDKAYGNYPKEKMPYLEDYPLMPRYPYDTSKACADLIAQSYASELYDIPIIITRFANIYGPGQLNYSALIPDCIRSALGYTDFVPRSDGNQIRDLLYVKDIIKLYGLLSKSLSENKDISGEVFNAGSDTPHLVKDVVKIIYERLDQMEAYKDIENAFKNNKTLGEIDCQYMNYEKLNKYFGWAPKTNLDDGINSTIEWYKEYLKKTWV